uniref:Uncharacterized protein n=1 Tax=Leptobrachium leishanense TaxID=445787 RepID=A0A8C5N488_9ANUR
MRHSGRRTPTASTEGGLRARADLLSVCVKGAVMQRHLRREVRIYKIILLGSTNVGKSSMILHLVKNNSQVTDSTIGGAFCKYKLFLQDKALEFLIWDTAGQERFQSVCRMYYRGATAALLVYDVTRKETFSRAQVLLHEVEKYFKQGEVIVFLIGNKKDLQSERKVSQEFPSTPLCSCSSYSVPLRLEPTDPDCLPTTLPSSANRPGLPADHATFSHQPTWIAYRPRCLLLPTDPDCLLTTPPILHQGHLISKNTTLICNLFNLDFCSTLCSCSFALNSIIIYAWSSISFIPTAIGFHTHTTVQVFQPLHHTSEETGRVGRYVRCVW